MGSIFEISGYKYHHWAETSVLDPLGRVPDTSITIGITCYTVQNREFLKNTPKILFGDFLRIP